MLSLLTFKSINNCIKNSCFENNQSIVILVHFCWFALKHVSVVWIWVIFTQCQFAVFLKVWTISGVSHFDWIHTKRQAIINISPTDSNYLFCLLLTFDFFNLFIWFIGWPCSLNKWLQTHPWLQVVVVEFESQASGAFRSPSIWSNRNNNVGSFC